jgi:hypothetical protein
MQRTDTEPLEARSTVLLSHTISVTISQSSTGPKRRVSAPTPGWWVRNPIAALRLAQRARDLRLEPSTVWHGVAQWVVSFHDGDFIVKIDISAMTGLPSATEEVVSLDEKHISESIAWNALGDVIDRTEYLNWSVVDGIRYPLQQDTLRNGQLLRTLVISSAMLNVSLNKGDFALQPGEAFTAGSVQDYRPDQKVPGPYPDKPVAEIAPGVIQIPNSWYSTIVRQSDGLVIIDAPISAGYAKGVLAEAARRYPTLPVKALITSTGFFWHVAGIREFAARGIPIYADVRNVPVIERILAAPHTLVPDDLAAKPAAKSAVIPVTGRVVIGKGPNSIEIYPVTQATQPMLMSYLRDSRLLHTAEMVQPLGPSGSILFPESLIELIHSVRADGLIVDRMIGMHMSPTPWSALEDTLKSAKAGA